MDNNKIAEALIKLAKDLCADDFHFDNMEFDKETIEKVLLKAKEDYSDLWNKTKPEFVLIKNHIEGIIKNNDDNLKKDLSVEEYKAMTSLVNAELKNVHSMREKLKLVS